MWICCVVESAVPTRYVDPIPAAPIPLRQPAALDEAQARLHASAAKRPLSLLFRDRDGGGDGGSGGGDASGRRVLAEASFAAASVIAYHRNTNDTGGQSLAQVLSSQGAGSLVNVTPDFWTDLQSGFVLDGGGGGGNSVGTGTGRPTGTTTSTGTLQRVDAHTLASTSPASAFSLRAIVLAVQTPTADVRVFLVVRVVVMDGWVGGW
jgi:hypothetical protein